MSVRRLVPLGLTILLTAVIGCLPILADENVVEMTVYFSPICDSCHLVREQILTPLLESYGERVKATYVDVSQAEGLSELEAVEARFGRTNSPLPVILVGDQFIASDDPFEVKDALVAYLQAHLATDGTPTTVESVPAELTVTSPAPTNPAGPTSVGRIHVAYVEKDGCDHCARAAVVLEALKSEFPGLVVTTFNNTEDADLIEAMGAHLGLPQGRRLIAPSIYVGTDSLVDTEVTSGNLRELLTRYAHGGAEPFWEGLDVSGGRASILRRFQTMGPLAVIAAAFIDGINPCAFATILFFVSYLAISKRSRGALLAVGLAFTGGVFVAYLAVGLGAMQLLQWASTVRVVSRVLYGLMAASCLALAGISVHDYRLAREGRLHEMRLNLPDPLRERIRGRIRSKSGAFVGAAFVSGLFVSILELACTGQVYLPTISFVVGVPEMRASALLYLVLYNLVFVVPLLVVLVLATYGVSAKRFQDWFVRNAATSKLVMALLFLVLGLLLVSQVLTA